MKKFFFFFLLVGLNLWAAIPQKENLNFATQINIAKNQRQPMSARWQALLKAADVAQYEQIAEIKAFAQSKDWYMRNATLVALEKINVNHAIDEAQLLLRDKALVVRSAAVDVLSRRFTRENRDLMASELSKPYNFRGKQSLWIRSKIFNIIATKATADDRTFLTKYLFDNDPKIVSGAMSTLERLTDVKFLGKTRIEDWRAFVKKNGWI